MPDHSPSAASQVMETIVRSGVIGIIRTHDVDTAVFSVGRVWQTGLDVVEVALTTPDALLAIETLAGTAATGQVIGAGTVLGSANARAAVAAGARLLVTPTFEPDVIRIGQHEDVTTVIGCATPTEMLRATELGADAVKIFPASLWTPQVLRDLLQPLPHLRCVPTGGITPDSAPAWIRAGAVAVGIGAALTTTNDPAGQVRRLKDGIARARRESHGRDSHD